MNKRKNICREKILKLITPKPNWYKRDKILAQHLKRYIIKNRYKRVMIFIPLKKEVNIAPIIKQLRQKGIALYVPFMEGESFKLVKYRLPLHTKKFGIKEPNISNIKIKKIDLAIIPIVGVDRDCKRVGFGKGMYDRFFDRYKIVKKRIFLARELFICNKSVTNRYDIDANEIFTTSIKIVSI